MATPRRRRHQVACSKSADNQENGNEQAEWSEYKATPIVRPTEASVREVDQCSDTERDQHRHNDEGTECTKPVATAPSHVIAQRPYHCAAPRRGYARHGFLLPSSATFSWWIRTALAAHFFGNSGLPLFMTLAITQGNAIDEQFEAAHRPLRKRLHQILGTPG